jgi:hypothetical protein
MTAKYWQPKSARRSTTPNEETLLPSLITLAFEKKRKTERAINSFTD